MGGIVVFYSGSFKLKAIDTLVKTNLEDLSKILCGEYNFEIGIHVSQIF